MSRCWWAYAAPAREAETGIGIVFTKNSKLENDLFSPSETFYMKFLLVNILCDNFFMEN